MLEAMESSIGTGTSIQMVPLDGTMAATTRIVQSTKVVLLEPCLIRAWLSMPTKTSHGHGTMDIMIQWKLENFESLNIR